MIDEIEKKHLRASESAGCSRPSAAPMPALLQYSPAPCEIAANTFKRGND